MYAGTRKHYREILWDERLNKLKKVVDWEVFRPVLEGFPHVDVMLMAKMLVLQAW